jgi:amino acid adenylation domain-containing protein
MDKGISSKMESQKGSVFSTTRFETVTEWINYGFRYYNDATALEFGQQKNTYRELDLLSNKIANYLAGQGIKCGDRVGICLDRSPEMIASIIGILKSGAAYVPLDANYPIERLSMMSEDAGLSLLIIHREYKDRFIDKLNCIVHWESIEQELENHATLFEPPKIGGKDVAYIIFTSGSTGRPKGIEMPHRALANLISWQLERSCFKLQARVLQYSSISFDVSFQEIATTFASGGTLVLVKDSDRRDPRILLDIIKTYDVERLFIPFVALRSLVEVANTSKKYPVSLIEVITAGEQLRVDSGLRLFFEQLPAAILDNQYGPSETHVISAYLLDKDPSKWSDLPPIGKPIKNNHIYILDENLDPVVKGEQGELYLAGKNLAHGYIGRDDLTTKAFIKNPVEILNYPVLYKTGDLGFYNEQGNIEFLGRADHQIKIRGHRVEPGEIDTIGMTYPGISQCITHAIQDRWNRTQLVTYYLPKNGADIQTETFKAHLAGLLPEYMIPAFVIELKKIPYTPSGKVDVKSLPKPDVNIGIYDEAVDYSTQTERRLAEIWSTVLGMPDISPKADYFELGGDSLNAVTLFMEIEQEFGKYLPLATLTQASTIKELAQVIDKDSVEKTFTDFRSLQVIQSGDPQKIPLFLVHGGAGNVLMFNDLAKGVWYDQPIYAFQWPGWDGQRGENTILGMAKFYKKELLKAFPQGPYFLGGHCIGGIIAIELANLLKEDGKEVLDPILVSDAPNLHSKWYYPTVPEDSEEYQEMFRNLQAELQAEMIPDNADMSSTKEKSRSKKKFPLLAKLLPFYSDLGKIYSAFRYQLRDFIIQMKAKMSIPIPVQDRRFYSGKAQLDAIKKHKKTTYSGDIIYFKSEVLDGRVLNLKGWWNDIFFGFEEICEGNFDGYVIGGEHNDVLKSNDAHEIIKDKMLRINE